MEKVRVKPRVSSMVQRQHFIRRVQISTFAEPDRRLIKLAHGSGNGSREWEAHQEVQSMCLLMLKEFYS